MADHHGIEALHYALAKQVPAMKRGFTIQTSYGDLTIDAEDAERFVTLARMVLVRKLSRSCTTCERIELDAAQLVEIAEQFLRAEAMFDVIVDGWHVKDETYLAAKTGMDLVSGAARAIGLLLQGTEVGHG
ncbi:hypothetical protein [Burkholderia stagnalis]|uniref:hypothetical protein n=1 Tax=Burkholderia stagnalis TaxID=1503054 RepID=UPI000F5C5FDB|nr:hypothetical protein [Burkholderia stagnalis]RQY25348.1 hypothetical protein DF117_05865 [Burkholderia stagnalis]RQZ01489.1 hypothetical protein DF106_04235 [Burkholderia stagnalis]RQZ07066.1 hypothetical protein DF105_06575 [Burkholderia stagnalis]